MYDKLDALSNHLVHFILSFKAQKQTQQSKFLIKINYIVFKTKFVFVSNIFLRQQTCTIHRDLNTG